MRVALRDTAPQGRCKFWSRFRVCLCTLALGIAATAAGSARSAGVTVTICSDVSTAGMGETVAVTAMVTRDGRIAPAEELHAYLNGRRWGADVVTDDMGRATFLLPLPHVGEARIQVVAPTTPRRAATWIWANTTADAQTVFFSKPFSVSGAVHHAALWMTCDNQFQADLNGHTVLAGNGFKQVMARTDGLEKALQQGENVLVVRGTNISGPAGLLGLLEIETDDGMQTIPTDGTWQTARDRDGTGGKPAQELAPVGEGVWGTDLTGWPGLVSSRLFPIGESLPSADESVVRSNTLSIRVRAPASASERFTSRDTEHQIGMAWEPWFTPLNARWNTAEAIPLLGRYASDNADVARQHVLWMNQIGIDFLLADWSNNLWSKAHWNEHEAGVDQLVRATTVLMDTLVALRKEGIPTPRLSLLLGLINGPPAKMSALNEELQFVYETYIAPPRYRDLWETFQGKPLILVLNTQGKSYQDSQPAIDTSRFTVRWMSTRLEKTHHELSGYWSWMDGTIHPIPTPSHTEIGNEALTVTPAFFADGGWTGSGTVGRCGGATLIEEFKTALTTRPRFLLINQWNEFTGQEQGQGFGPHQDVYVDAYSVPLSDDIEPTSLTAVGYRGGPGWGFYYQNLTRALIAIYRGQAPESTVLAVAHPAAQELVTGPALSVEWNMIGHTAKNVSLLLDGKLVAQGVTDSRFDLPVAGLTAGTHRVTIRADGAVTRFPLSTVQEDITLSTPIPCTATVPFTYAGTLPDSPSGPR